MQDGPFRGGRPGSMRSGAQAHPVFAGGSASAPSKAC